MAVIEVFSAGCDACNDAVRTVRDVACPECKVAGVSVASVIGNARASGFGIARVPAVVVNGVLAECCRGGAPDRDHLAALIAAA